MSKQPLSNLLASIREDMRTVVRELGMLGDAHADLNLSNSQVHALIELERQQAISVIELASRLRLEKSSVSRLVEGMIARRLVKIAADPDDGRRKLVSLAAGGKEKLRNIHEQANARVAGALEHLSIEERQKIASGLALYARALSLRSRK